MKFEICGLGRMGAALALQALKKGHEVVGFDPEGSPELEQAGATVVDSIGALVDALAPPRVALVYVPHGDATEKVVSSLADRFGDGDVVVDGGNTHWDESIRRHHALGDRGIRFLDAGTSGGVTGVLHGACFMVGGDADAYTWCVRCWRTWPRRRECCTAGHPEPGTLSRTSTTWIEFGMVQAIGEGVEMLKRADAELDLAAVFHNWNHGSIMRSWLVELMERALRSEHEMDRIDPYIDDTGEQRWGIEYAMRKEIPVPLLAQAVWGFYESRDPDRPWAKTVALLRHEYGRHPLQGPAGTTS